MRLRPHTENINNNKVIQTYVYFYSKLHMLHMLREASMYMNLQHLLNIQKKQKKKKKKKKTVSQQTYKRMKGRTFVATNQQTNKSNLLLLPKHNCCYRRTAWYAEQ